MCPIWQSNCRIFDEVSARGEEAPEGRRASLLRARTVSFGRHNRHRREPPESRAVTSAGRMVSSLFRSDKSGNPAYILVEKVRSNPRARVTRLALPRNYSFAFRPSSPRVYGVPMPRRATDGVRRTCSRRPARVSDLIPRHRAPTPARPHTGSDVKNRLSPPHEHVIRLTFPRDPDPPSPVHVHPPQKTGHQRCPP